MKLFCFGASESRYGVILPGSAAKSRGINGVVFSLQDNSPVQLTLVECKVINIKSTVMLLNAAVSQRREPFFFCHGDGAKCTVLILFLSLQDYFYQLTCITEREKFLVPI